MWLWWTCLLAVVLETVGSSISVPLRDCTGGRRMINGRCRPVLDYDDNYDDSNLLPEVPVTTPICLCVPHYLCSSDHIVKRKLCLKPKYVCCSDFVVQENETAVDSGCGWGPAVTESEAPGDAVYGEFPWVVVILKETAKEFWSQEDHVAGGALIHPRVVLTAAHKLDRHNATELICRAGEWSRTEKEPAPYQQRFVRRFIQHEGYSRKYVSNSVALVFLRTPFDVSHGAVGVACVGNELPPQDAICFATGWGRKSYGGEYAHRLKKIPVPVSLRGMCQAALRLTRLGRTFTLHSSVFCAGGVAGVDTCTGDGGSPLLCKINGNATATRYAVFGLTAWGLGCGQSGKPAVYVAVPQFRPWFRDVMEARGLNTNSFLYQNISSFVSEQKP